MKDLEWFGDKAKSLISAGRLEGLTRAAGLVLGVANRTCPYQEGTLVGSGATDVDRSSGEASVFYDTPYAVRLHENPQYRFNFGRRGKWLSLALGETDGAVNNILADSLKDKLP